MRVLRLFGDQLPGLPPTHGGTGAGLSQPTAGRPRTLPAIQLGAMDLGSDRGNRVRSCVVAARIERDGDAADAELSPYFESCPNELPFRNRKRESRHFRKAAFVRVTRRCLARWWLAKDD